MATKISDKSGTSLYSSWATCILGILGVARLERGTSLSALRGVLPNNPIFLFWDEDHRDDLTNGDDDAGNGDYDKFATK